MQDEVADLVSAPRLAIVGAGAIVRFHAEAFRTAGWELAAVAARPGSDSARAAAERHGIETAYDDVGALLSARSRWDALLVAVSTPQTMDVLGDVLRVDAPVLVEKPIATSSRRIAQLRPHAERIVVGYNRRFYPMASLARAEVAGGPPTIAHLALPENVRPDGALDDHLTPLFVNTVHGLDLARFVFGDLHLVSVERVVVGDRLRSAGALLRSPRGDLVVYTGAFGTPANYALSIERAGRRVELRPFEHATVYEGMDVVPPTTELPVKRYVPRVVDEVTLGGEDLSHKPGFVAQARAFAELLRTGDAGIAARLDDAEAAVRLAEAIADRGSVDPTRPVSA